jgi:hypothetical protein
MNPGEAHAAGTFCPFLIPNKSVVVEIEWSYDLLDDSEQKLFRIVKCRTITDTVK